MRKKVCEGCGGSFGLGAMVSVFGRSMCESCAERRLEGIDQETITPETVYRLDDPTVCARCGADNGSTELGRVLEMPVCEECRERIERYPFPLWIKAACLGLAVVVAWTFAVNLRFFRARVLIEQATALVSVEGGVAEASAKMARAAELVPEAADLAMLSNYWLGIAALEDRPAEALACMERCGGLPAEFGVKNIVLQARISLAFDEKDYEGFLRLSQEQRRQQPDAAMAAAGVASAYACLYAVHGRAQDRELALEALAEAERMGEQDPEGIAEYKERILHRIETRQIITRKEYHEMKAMTTAKAEDGQ